MITNLNRVVAVLAALLTLALGLLPVLANFDVTSTAGVIASIIAILGVVVKWLDGWQKHEAREAGLLIVPREPDVGDAGADTA